MPGQDKYLGCHFSSPYLLIDTITGFLHLLTMNTCNIKHLIFWDQKSSSHKSGNDINI
jgi:hypothetical protein